MWTKLTGFMRDFRTLAWPYWVSEDRWRAWGLAAVVAVLAAAQVKILVMFNDWYAEFFNALQNYDLAAFWSLCIKFIWMIAAPFVAVSVYQVYWRQMLEIRWRRWLTNRYLGDWFAERSYYRLSLYDTGTDNPDQRIADDLRLFVAGTLDLTISFGRNVGSLISFSVILWTVSGAWTVPGTSVEIHGYMFWAALVYAIAGTWLTHLVGRPLVRLNFTQQLFEANFRFGLVRVRENPEGIALYRGEADEQQRLGTLFQNVWQNWWELMRRQKKLSSLTATYDQATTLFPYVVAAPRYFAKELTLGGLQQLAQAFGRVQDGLSWFVSAYAALAEYRATVDRLISFRRALVFVRTESARAGISIKANGSDAVALQDVTLALPRGAVLLRGADVKIERGERVVVSGASGSGKSTLFRAIAGIWPFGAGRIERPDTAECLFLPQKPYLPIGSLRGALAYPAAGDAFSDEVLRAKLEACRLGHLTSRLDEVAHWEQQLSPGEQQRVAFVRALLHQPAWLFMDEASSALDSDMEGQLYALLERELPETTWVSIAHRAAIEKFHRRRLAIRDDGRLESAPLTPAVPAPS